MLNLTHEQLQAATYHATQLRRIEKGQRYIVDTRTRVYLMAPDHKPNHDDPLAEGYAMDVTLPASVIRRAAQVFIKQHRDALQKLGIAVTK